MVETSVESRKAQFIESWQMIGPSDLPEDIDEEDAVVTSSQELQDGNIAREATLYAQMQVLGKYFPTVYSDIGTVVRLEGEMVDIYRQIKSGTAKEGAGEAWANTSARIAGIEGRYSNDGVNADLGIVFKTGITASRQLEIVRQAIKANGTAQMKASNI